MSADLEMVTRPFGANGVAHERPGERPVYEHQFQVTFREACHLSRHVYFTHMAAWIGKMRELPMQQIADDLLRDFGSGEWGIVTNSTRLQVLGQASAYDVIRARSCLGDVEGSTFSGHFEFAKVMPDGSATPLALGEVRATWVRLMDYGVPSPQECPDYVENYLEDYGARRNGGLTGPVDGHLSNLDLGKLLFEKPPGLLRGPTLWTETFPTTFEEACVVGNVYYGNYFIWQGRVRDLFLYSAAPDLLRTTEPEGELACLSAEMKYLREAMPFDRIHVKLQLESLTECGATFQFEFYRETPDRLEKLSVGRQETAWLKRSVGGDATPCPWPDQLRRALLPA